jgi:hypothetical protein
VRLPPYWMKPTCERTRPETPSYTFAASDAPLRFRDVGRHFVGDVLREVEQVDVEGVEHAA